jgi:transcriptional regulator with XRE-family HTH domain/Zn-dependent peptidase ImmA (M78 family)
MSRVLDQELLRTTMEKRGLTFTALAREMGVSVESVSKWVRGVATPRPGKAFRLGQVLDLTHEQLYGKSDAVLEPQIAFRITRNQAPSDGHRARARDMARMYEQLVPYLPFSRFVAPQQLKNPGASYEYLEELCVQLRREMGLGAQDPIALKTLFEYLSSRLQAVVVPVFWNHRSGGAELAAHIYSPKTQTTWIPFNLDTKAWDARFWVAHELAHALTFQSFDADQGEVFADAFAGTLVMPPVLANAAYSQMRTMRTFGERFKIAVEVGERLHISPVCVAKQVERFARETGAEALGLDTPQLYKSIARPQKAAPTVSQELFPKGNPSVAEFRRAASDFIKTPFFETLSKYLRDRHGGPAFIQGLLDCPLEDAIALNRELA